MNKKGVANDQAPPARQPGDPHSGWKTKEKHLIKQTVLVRENGPRTLPKTGNKASDK